MSRNLIVTKVEPNAGIAGGEVMVYLLGVTAGMLPTLGLNFGGAEAHVVSINTTRALALVPEVAAYDPVEVTVEDLQTRQSSDGNLRFTVGKLLARNLHPVANP